MPTAPPNDDCVNVVVVRCHAKFWNGTKDNAAGKNPAPKARMVQDVFLPLMLVVDSGFVLARMFALFSSVGGRTFFFFPTNDDGWWRR